MSKTVQRNNDTPKVRSGVYAILAFVGLALALLSTVSFTISNFFYSIVQTEWVAKSLFVLVASLVFIYLYGIRDDFGKNVYGTTTGLTFNLSKGQFYTSNNLSSLKEDKNLEFIFIPYTYSKHGEGEKELYPKQKFTKAGNSNELVSRIDYPYKDGEYKIYDTSNSPSPVIFRVPMKLVDNVWNEDYKDPSEDEDDKKLEPESGKEYDLIKMSVNYIQGYFSIPIELHNKKGSNGNKDNIYRPDLTLWATPLDKLSRLLWELGL